MPCFANGKPWPEAGNGGCTPYTSTVYRDGSQTLSTGAKTVVNFTNVEAGENPAGMFNLATDTATIPYTGTWVITATLEIIISGSGYIYGGIEVNGVPYAIDSDEIFAPGYGNVSLSVTKYLTAGNTVQVWAQQYSGLNGTLNGVTRRVNCSISSICVS